MRVEGDMPPVRTALPGRPMRAGAIAALDVLEGSDGRLGMRAERRARMRVAVGLFDPVSCLSHSRLSRIASAPAMAPGTRAPRALARDIMNRRMALRRL